MKSIYLRNYVLTFIAFLAFFEVQAQNCPMVFNPVTGKDGVTYLNACFAEEANEDFYTQGVAFGSCIDVSLMDQNAVCGTNYDPVVGCNGAIYRNACEATRHGVTSYMPQGVMVDDAYMLDECFNYQVIQNAFPEAFNYANGTLTVNCPGPTLPVCGCNGINYTSPCEAEASGVIDYTYGACGTPTNNQCIDDEVVAMMNPADCDPTYAPVCGCNDMTYINQCAADNSGVSRVLPGNCGNMAWRNNATLLRCGQPVTGNTAGSQNLITNYNGCTNVSLLGVEDVYVIHKTEPGDLQVYLGIDDPSIDLDLFVLDGMSTGLCVGQSIGPVGQFAEGVLVENAPIGTYYVIVDAEFATTAGSYTLQTGCGFMDTESAVEIQCGVPMATSNIRGENNMLAFNCTNTPSLSGPEMIYTFSVITDAVVSIDLFNMTADMNMYLLNELDLQNCIGASALNGTAPERIALPLAAGTYFVIVDGGNGATGDYMLNVNCSTAGCNMVNEIIAEDSDCNEATGRVIINNLGSTNSEYVFALDGPVTDNGADPLGEEVFDNLPPGTYMVYATDAFGCTSEEEVTISSGNQGFLANFASNFNATTGIGDIEISITGGFPPYTIFIDGVVHGETNSTTYQITNLREGNYEVKVMDATECEQFRTAAITNPCSLYTTLVPMDEDCGGLGNISVDVYNGTPPFTVTLNGAPAPGSPFAATWFGLNNLNAGFYTVVVTDANGCSDTGTTTVNYNVNNIILNATPTAATCGTAGSIAVTTTGGVAPFSATLNGAPAGNYPGPDFTLTGVAPGTYTLEVQDAWSCTQSTSVTVGGSNAGLTVSGTTTAASCTAPGSASITVTGGTAPYTVTANGAAVGTFNTNTFTAPGLAPGTYTIEVTDANSCTGNTSVTVGGSTGGVSIVTATPTAAGCATGGSIAVDVSGGTAPYAVTLDGAAVAGSPFATTWFNLTDVAVGNHTIVVTDANGCTDMTTVTVGGSTGGVSIVTATPTAATCNTPGSIGVDVTGGTAPYAVTLNGSAVAGSPFANTWFSLAGLAGATYTMVVTDANGCSDQTTVTVGNNGGNITLTPTPTPAGCNGGLGSISVAVAGGTAPYAVSVNGSFVGNTSMNPINVINAPAGVHTISVVDANGCTASTTSTVTGGAGGVTIISATPTAGSCSAPGSIGVDVAGGTAPYAVTLNGTAVGTYNATWFAINNVAPGTYIMVVTDANGCSDQTNVTVQGIGGGLTLTPTGTTAACGGYGSISVAVAGGTAPFSVTVNGSFAGNTTLNPFDVVNVPAGSYNISVTDANGCTGTTTATVAAGGAKLVASGNASPASCASPGMVQLDIVGGTGPFDVFLDGNLVTNTTNRWYIIQNVTAGAHNIEIVDANGCNDDFNIIVAGSGGNIGVTATNTGSSTCGGGSVGVDVTGGTAPYTISVNGTVVGTTSNIWFSLSGMPSGSNTILITDVNGCTGSTNIVVPNSSGTKFTVTANPSNASCSGPGMLQLDIVGGAAPFDIFLDGNFVTTTNNRWYIIQNVAAGNHTVKVVDKNGCDDDYDVTVTTSGGNLTLGATSTAGSCSGGGTIQIDVNGGQGPFDVELDGVFVVNTNDRWYTITNVAPGGYTISVTDANGCTATHQEVVQGNNGNLTLGATSTAGSCSGGGTIQIDVNGGQGPFDVELDGVFVVNTNDRWYTITNVAPGGYTIKVTDANGCMATHQEVVGSTGGASFTVKTFDLPKTCDKEGAIRLDIVGSVPNWDVEVDGNLVTTTDNRWYVIDNLTPGTHNIKVTDKTGCSVTVVGTVTDNSFAPDIKVTTKESACGSNTGKITIRVDNGGALPYDVMVDGVAIATTSTTLYIIDNVAPGTYDVGIRNESECTTTKTVTVGTPTFTVKTFDLPATCDKQGGIRLDIVGSQPSWDVEIDGNFVVNTDNRWYVIDRLSPGSYDIKVTDALGCVATVTGIVSDNRTPPTIAVTSSPSSCSGSTGSIDIQVSAGGALPYDVMLDGVAIATTSDNSYTISNVATGTYEVGIRNESECISTETVTVSTPSFKVKTFDLPATCAAKGGIRLDIVGSQPNWDVEIDGNFVTNTDNRWYVIDNLNPGSYDIKVTDGQGCVATVTGVVSDNRIPPTIAVTASPSSCSGSTGSIDIQVSAGGALPYDVMLDGVAIATTSDNSYTISNVAAGTYEVGIRNESECISTETVTVGTPSFTVKTFDLPATCAAKGGIRLDIVGSQPNWDVELDGNFITNTDNRWYVIDRLNPGSYNIKVTDGQGCVATVVGTVSDNTTPPNITATANSSGCSGSTGSITIQIAAGGALPYDVMLDGVAIATTSDNSYTINNVATGTYQVGIRNESECISTQSVTVNAASSPITLNTSATNAGCNGMAGSVTVNIAGGTAPYEVYLGGNRLTSVSSNVYTITGLQGGNYTVEIRDANGCSSSINETVQQSSNVSFNATGVNAGCGTMNGSITISNIVGTAPYTIFLNGSTLTTTNDNSFVIGGLGGGSYVVAVADVNTCDASQAIVIGGSMSNITLNATAFAENCDAMDGNIALDIVGGVGPFEVYVDGVLVTTTNDRWYNIMGLNTGTYNLRVVDVNGCEATGTYTVLGNTAINVATTSTSGSCGATTGTITVESTGGLAPYTVFLNGTSHGSTFNQFFTIAGVVPGTYDVRVVDDNGCEQTVQETVGGSNAFAVTAVPTNVSCGVLGSVEVSIQTGTSPFDIYVNGNPAGSTNDNSFTVSNLAAGDYDVRIVDASGCEDTKKVTVGGSNALGITVTAEPDNCGNNGAANIQMQNGTAPYTIELDGTTIATASGNNYRVTNLVSGGYLVKVTDANGCSNEMVVMINNSGQAPNAAFTFIYTPGGVVKFFSNNPGGTVDWDFGDGTTSIDVNPIKAFAVGQSYEVCLTATNACGTVEECQTLNVPTVYSSNLSFTIGDAPGRPGETVDVPIEVDNFDRVMSFQYTIQLKDGTVGKITGVTSTQLTDLDFDILNDETVMLHWESADNDGLSLPNDQVIFNVQVEMNGSRGACTPAEFVNVPMNVEVRQRWFNDPTLVIPNFFNGQVCVSNMVNISGRIVREDVESIPNVEVTCNSAQTIMTDPVTGEYTFNGSQLGSSCLILPTKDGDDNMGLSVMDIIKIRRHIMNVSTLNSPYKIIASDVNRDKEVDENDLSIIGDLILGNQDQMFQGDSWRFLPAGWSFTDPEEPFAPLFPVMINLQNLTGDMANQDFMGMKLGDVDNSLDMPTMTDGINMNGQLTFHTDDQTVAQGDEFVLDIRSSDFTNVCGFQMELNFDPARFDFVEMLSGDLATLPQNMVGINHLNDGVLTVLWYDRALSALGISHDANDVLFRLKFKATQGFNSMAGLFEMGSTMTKGVGVNIGNQHLDIDFQIDGATSSTGEQVAEAFELEQNRPNPFSDRTYIGFTLPSPQNVGFELVDQQGRVIQRTQQFYNKGYQQIIVEGKDLPTSGIYFYRMTVADKSVSKKLIYMKR